MIRRPLPFRITIVAAAAFGLAAPQAHAQSLELRSEIDSSVGGFPNSPSTAPLTTPERVSPPTTDASPAAADDQTPPAAPAQNEPDEGAPNYGKPRKMRAKLYRPNPKTSPPLSPLVPYRGAPGLRRVLNPAPPPKDAIDPEQPAPTVAVIPSPPRVRKPPVDIDPYAPLGIRTGDLILKPFVEGTTGYESNPNQVATGVKPSVVLRSDAGLDVSSDFSSSSLSASLRGGYSDFPSNTNANRPDASALVDGRVDVTRQDTIDTEARFTLATQTPGSPLLAVPNSVYIVNRPTIVSEGATLGGTHSFGRLSVSLKGTFDRTEYGDATQSNGSIYRYSQDNYNDYGIVARANYEITPGVIPFAELGFDERVRDNPADLDGYLRDSVGGVARAGAKFDINGYFTGTASAGYLDRHYEDPRLPNLRGPTIDGSLAYAVTPLTTITVKASTTASETTLAGASGAISRLFSAEIAHTFFRNFTLSGIATYQPNDYQGVSGSEQYATLTLKGAYSFTRDVQLTASASYQTLKSTFVGDTFRDEVFLVGFRLQR